MLEHFTLYIGLNVDGSPRIDGRKITIDTLAKHFDSFTVWEGYGYWNGEPEDTLIVAIGANDRTEFLMKVRQIADDLEQDCIGVVVYPPDSPQKPEFVTV